MEDLGRIIKSNDLYLETKAKIIIFPVIMYVWMQKLDVNVYRRK